MILDLSVMFVTSKTVRLKSIFPVTGTTRCLVFATSNWRCHESLSVSGSNYNCIQDSSKTWSFVQFNSSYVMSHSEASTSLLAVKGELFALTIHGLQNGSSYGAYCAQDGILSNIVHFNTSSFVEQPSVTYISSKQVTISMKVAQTGNLSCMAVANGDSIPSANDIVSIDNKTHGTYDNTIRATANVVEIYSIYNLLEGVDYDVYCALDDLVSDKLDIYTSRVINHTIATEITGTTVKLITTFDAAQYVRCIILYDGSDTPSATQIYNGT